MKYHFLIFIIFTIFFGLILNSNQLANAQNSSFYNTSKIVDEGSSSPSESITTTAASYNFEPFLLLNGTEYQDISHNDTLSLQNFTVASWIKNNQSTLPGPAVLVNKGGFNSDEEGKNMNYGFWFSSKGIIQGGFETKSGEYFAVNSTEKYNDGKWHFVLLAYDGNLLKLDIDGKEVSTKITGGALPDNSGTQPLRIGANSLEEDKFFNGALDEVRIWNRSLTASEISNASNNNISSSVNPIVYLDFNENGVNSIVPDSENNKKLQTNKNFNTFLEKEQKTSDTNEKIDVRAWNELVQQKSGNTQHNKAAYATTDKTNFNIAVAGDFGCSTRAEENIKNIELQEPELFLALGDLAYKPTPECWFTMTEKIDSKTKIAIGNHEDKEESEGSDVLIQEYLNHYQLPNSYYSFKLKNLHVLVLNTQLEFSLDTVASYAIPTPVTVTDDKDISDAKDQTNLGVPDTKLEDLLKKYSLEIKVPKLDKLLDKTALVPDLEVDPKQYEFAVDDLKKASNDESIDWIFVIFHKPIYSSPSKQLEEYIIREKYQPLFDQYNVDLVLQAHNHIYDRTLPIKFNPLNITNPIVDKTNNNSTFTNPDGTIYTVVGTGGKGPVRISDPPFYTVSQDKPVAGFLNINIDAKDLEATFYDIGLKCKEIKSKKTGKLVLDIESCKPRDESTQLKIVDTYKISKR
jgi:hypothetical protein